MRSTLREFTELEMSCAPGHTSEDALRGGGLCNARQSPWITTSSSSDLPRRIARTLPGSIRALTGTPRSAPGHGAASLALASCSQVENVGMNWALMPAHVYRLPIPFANHSEASRSGTTRMVPAGSSFSITNTD